MSSSFRVVHRPLFSLALLGLATSALLVSGCATRSSSADVYRAGETQVEQTFRTGVVEGVRGVTIQRD
ncbi:MAG: hypothetical protein RL258_782, partial [Pseudomonadota bacterium]